MEDQLKLDVMAVDQSSINVLNTPSVLQIAATIAAGLRARLGRIDQSSVDIARYALSDAVALIEIYNKEYKE